MEIDAITVGVVTVEVAVVEANMTVDLYSRIDKQSVTPLLWLVTVMSGLVLESPLPWPKVADCTRRTTCVPSLAFTPQDPCVKVSKDGRWRLKA